MSSGRGSAIDFVSPKTRGPSLPASMKRSISRSNSATEPAPAVKPRGVSGSDGAVSTESVRVAEPGRPTCPYALWPLLAERGI